MNMKPVVDNFFEKVLVMDKNENIRDNRIGLLQKINDRTFRRLNLCIEKNGLQGDPFDI